MKNKKTTLAGLSTLLITVGSIIHSVQIKDYSNLSVQITALATAIGLLCAKDNNVTGGSINQGSTPAVAIEKVAEQTEAVNSIRG